ncbi:MAG: aminoglycoside phosphotransferase family protein [Clostridia bacterium]|nr:aminoglycoside phosphotransferase family protein [Clostridia bacterium]
MLTIDVIKGFYTDIEDYDALEITKIESGHINQTFEVRDRSLAGTYRGHYIFQRINTTIFKDPVGLMNNIMLVTEFAAKTAIAAGKDPKTNTLTLMKSVQDKVYYIDSEGFYWRCYLFLPNSVNLDVVEVTPRTYVQAGGALADFQRMLADFDASKLCEVIPGFHDTRNRFKNLKIAIEENRSGRASQCAEEIKYALSLENITGTIIDRLRDGRLPLRVTHNDTKLSNIMIDNDTHEVLCLIDLDTVMPGSALYDFGDALRAGGSSAAEDEADLSKVHFLELNFEKYCEGYIGGARNFLTDEELDLLPEAAAILTYECGIRFLSDYLDGDTYFSTKYPEHNLVRARNQFKLVKDILGNLDRLHAIANKFR